MDQCGDRPLQPSTSGTRISSQSPGEMKNSRKQHQCATEDAGCMPSTESPTDICSPGTQGAASEHATHEYGVEPASRIRASAYTTCWLEISADCSPKSSRMMPTVSPAMLGLRSVAGEREKNAGHKGSEARQAIPLLFPRCVIRGLHQFSTGSLYSLAVSHLFAIGCRPDPRVLNRCLRWVEACFRRVYLRVCSRDRALDLAAPRRLITSSLGLFFWV
jgi:hypothetical protein